MPYVQRDARGQLSGVCANANPDAVEFISNDAPELLEFLNRPAPRQIRKSTVIARLTDAQLDQALSLMNSRQKERWRAPDHPVVNVNDQELLQVLQAIGADPNTVLAEDA